MALSSFCDFRDLEYGGLIELATKPDHWRFESPERKGSSAGERRSWELLACQNG
jgi:hypothetical protein